MTVRAARLLHLHDLLRRQRQPARGAWLAQTLGVSPRTVYRDIATLREQGAAIDGDPGVGYQMRPGFWLPPLMFSADELDALLLGARWVARQADPELAAAAEQALTRIASSLPPELRLAVETSGLFVATNAGPTPEPWLPTLRRAVREQGVLRLTYRDEQGQTSERTIWPFAMAFFAQTRLIAAWCELRADFRHFRADRVQALAETGARYPVGRHTLIARWRVQHAADRN